MVSERLETLREAAQITIHQVAAELGGVPEEKNHCSNLAVQTLNIAIEDFLKKKR